MKEKLESCCMAKRNSKTSFVCGVDFQHEIGEGPNDIKLYSSLEVLKKQRTCWRECGIVELDIKIKRWVEPQNIGVKKCVSSKKLSTR